MIFTAALLSLSAQAWCAPNQKLASIPHTIGRTAKNMVLFRDKAAAIEEWANLAASIGDGVVSEHVLETVPGSYEANPLFGKHPTAAKYLGITIPIGFYSAVVTQYGHERLDGTRKSWQTVLPLGITGGIHTFGMFWNEHELRVTCARAGITCK